MNIQAPDIYINNGTIWLSHDCVMRVCNISDVYLGKQRCLYKKGVFNCRLDRDIFPDTGKAWRWAKVNGSFFYAYDNIPDRHPTQYRSKFPKPEELAVIALNKENPENEFYNHFKNAINDNYKQYLHLYQDCTKYQQENISRYAALLAAAVQYISLHHTNTSKYSFFHQLVKFIKDHAVPYAPKHPRSLKEKVLAAMQQDVTLVAKIPRAGNQNRSKEYADEEIRSWVLQMKHTGRNYSDAHIIRKVRQMCALTGKPAPSHRWIGMNITEQHNVRYITAKKNFGASSRFANQYEGYQRFKNALFAGDCWQVDGTRVNILPHKAEWIEIVDGKEVLRKGKRYLWIVAVRDVHSGDVLGYTYTYNENRWEIHEALKMAVKEAGYLPYEIVFDKYQGHNSPEARQYLAELEHMGVKVTISSSKTVKQNLERWFGTMQDVFLQESKYYYGQGIKSTRRAAHRSEEYMTRMAREANKEGFDWQAACQHYDGIIEAYRTTPYKEWSKQHSHIDASPKELHDISEKPDVRFLEEQDYYFLFGLRPNKPVRFRGQGLIELTIRNIRFCYRCTDYNIVSNYPEVTIAYDLDDLSHIHIYKPSDSIIKQYLGRVEMEQQGQRYGSKANWGVIATNTTKIKKLEAQREEELQRKMAVGSDVVALINPMSVSKHVKEEAESHYLNEQFNIPDTPDDEGEGLNINIANNY